MEATELWSESALVINTLISRLGLWYRLEFVDAAFLWRIRFGLYLR